MASVLILYGVTGVYGCLTQLALTATLYPWPPAPIFLVVVLSVSLVFAVVALWCGLGLLSRDRGRLRLLVVFLWIYILWSVGMNVWTYIDHIFVSPATTSLEWASEDMLKSIELRSRYRVSSAIVRSIWVIVQSFFIVWVIDKLSSKLIQNEFRA